MCHPLLYVRKANRTNHSTEIDLKASAITPAKSKLNPQRRQLNQSTI
jgi:hypothetical protein